MRLTSRPLLLALCASTVRACMEFSGNFPFSNSLPYEAKIVDNNVTTCWLSTTYNEHSKLQNSLNPKPSKSKRSVGRRIKLTERPPLYSTSYGPEYPERTDSIESEKAYIPTDEENPIWQPWKFDCIEGHTAQANVGLRSFRYTAHGQDFNFVPVVKEDI